ncbi:Uncharacterised protein [Candidatus Bilamarchaeum dharawalense]|uniref:Uncharacterized protein n=1 Tax=Candidatus Bilamarchaeum dharawalense TaxID=2885759 RepID=A0A5E4LR62_9ARCH|nr:Uncharacterised protein [Candidatus Bilamarchaeum dharawalense]
MNRIYLFLILAILTIGSVVSSIAVTEYYLTHIPSSCEQTISSDDEFIWLPTKVSDLFLSDRIILHFSFINGENIVINGEVLPNKITHLKCGSTVDYDYEVWMSDINALELATSTKPTTTFVRLWRTGEIRIIANGSENEQKLSHADMLVAQDYEPVPVWIRNLFSKYIKN